VSEQSRGGALSGIRVIDLTTPLAEATGRVLADLGAEVIKVEPPGGCAARFIAPFEEGRAGEPDGSLFWRAYGLGKRSVVLDLEQAADRERLIELACGADIFIESSEPGALAAMGLGFDALHAKNPSLLYVSVTPFGQTGPKANHPATDLTLAAAGGLINLQGDGDRPPLPVGHPGYRLPPMQPSRSMHDIVMAGGSTSTSPVTPRCSGHCCSQRVIRFSRAKTSRHLEKPAPILANSCPAWRSPIAPRARTVSWS